MVSAFSDSLIFSTNCIELSLSQELPGEGGLAPLGAFIELCSIQLELIADGVNQRGHRGPVLLDRLPSSHHELPLVIWIGYRIYILIPSRLPFRVAHFLARRYHLGPTFAPSPVGRWWRGLHPARQAAALEPIAALRTRE